MPAELKNILIVLSSFNDTEIRLRIRLFRLQTPQRELRVLLSLESLLILLGLSFVGFEKMKYVKIDESVDWSRPEGSRNSSSSRKDDNITSTATAAAADTRIRIDDGKSRRDLIYPDSSGRVRTPNSIIQLSVCQFVGAFVSLSVHMSVCTYCSCYLQGSVFLAYCSLNLV